ncbi:MAG: immunity 26/phosphotriesterase HocA family protein [Leptospiraceae bacterium]|nr:immunity 26/phosphotriesterase HocA family protein [Leptospiraceae bacterium]
MKTNKQQRTIGAIVKVPLEKGFYGYARILEGTSFAFYDLRSTEELSDLSKIVSSPILFIISVNNYAVTDGRWSKIGKLPLEKTFDVLPPRYTQDLLSPDKFKIIYSDGTVKNATKKECNGLERFAVWQPQQVEQRLSDYFMGRKNRHLEQMNPDGMHSQQLPKHKQKIAV